MGVENMSNGNWIIKNGVSNAEWIKEYMRFKNDEIKMFFETDIDLYHEKDYDDIDKLYSGNFRDIIFMIITECNKNYTDIKDHLLCPQCLYQTCINQGGNFCGECNYKENHGYCEWGDNPYHEIRSENDCIPLNKNQDFIESLKKFVNNTIEIKEI
jgi:hypothetical protein